MSKKRETLVATAEHKDRFLPCSFILFFLSWRIWKWGKINPITANDKVETHAKKGPFSLDPTPHFSPLTLHSGCGSPLKQERWYPFCRLQNQWQIFQFLLHWREVPSTLTILKLWYILSWRKNIGFCLTHKAYDFFRPGKASLTMTVPSSTKNSSFTPWDFKYAAICFAPSIPRTFLKNQLST